MNVLTAAAGIGMVIYQTYLASGFGLALGRYGTTRLAHGTRARAILNTIWWWTKWPALAGILTIWADSAFVESPDTPTANAILLGLNLAFWWAWRNDGDDDERKRRRQALKAKIEQVGGKLVIIPATAQARP